MRQGVDVCEINEKQASAEQRKRTDKVRSASRAVNE